MNWGIYGGRVAGGEADGTAPDWVVVAGLGVGWEPGAAPALSPGVASSSAMIDAVQGPGSEVCTIESMHLVKLAVNPKKGWADRKSARMAYNLV